MKALIWILTVLIFNFLNALLGVATGIKIGYVLIWLPIWFVASRLCKAWDNYKENRKGAVTVSQEIGEYQSKSSGGLDKTEVTMHFEQPIAAVNPTVPPIKFCRKCGFELIYGSEFCSKCGTAIVKE